MKNIIILQILLRRWPVPLNLELAYLSEAINFIVIADVYCNDFTIGLVKNPTVKTLHQGKHLVLFGF